jgi:hypothetical protein
MMQTRNQSCQWGGPENFFFPKSVPPRRCGVARIRGRMRYRPTATRPRRLWPPCPLRDGRRISSGSSRLDRGLPAFKRPVVAINQLAMGSVVTRHHDSPRDDVSSELESQAAWPYRDLGGSPALARQADWPLGSSPSWPYSRYGQPGRMGPRPIIVIGNLVLRERCRP